MYSACKIIFVCILLGLASTLRADENEDSGRSIDEYLVDVNANSISAAAMAKVDHSVIQEVADLKALSLAINTLNKDDGQAAGLQLNFSRAGIIPIDYSDYHGSETNPTPTKTALTRLLASLSVSYAKGSEEINEVSYTREAVGVSVSGYYSQADDPLIQTAEKCLKIAAEQQVDPIPGGPPQTTKPITYKECLEKVNYSVKWNASSYSLAITSGQIRAKGEPAIKHSLGNAANLTVRYGFDGLNYLNEHAALFLGYTKHFDEPVETSLGQGQSERVTTEIAAARFTYGGSRARGLIEVSSRSEDLHVGSSSIFKQAVGFDYKVYEGVWVNFRFGKKLTSAAEKEEKTGMLSVNISPNVLFKFPVESE